MRYDAIVIGGGPGGSTASTFLAKSGRRVLVLEKEHFPRFHIGESLLPYNNGIFDEMGVTPALENAGFPKKLGAQFHLSNSSHSLKLCFRKGKYTRHISSIQVERAKFDHILLKHAAASGAEVREGWIVTKFTNDRNGVSVTARGENGKTETFEGQFLIDATGRVNFTGNQENLRIVHPRLKKLSVFGHFEGVRLDPGESTRRHRHRSLRRQMVLVDSDFGNEGQRRRRHGPGGICQRAAITRRTFRAHLEIQL